MTFADWLENSAGVWWEPAVPGTLVQALGASAPRGVLPAVTVVPTGAPLLGRVTPIENCRAYANLFGCRRTEAEALTCLRTLEVPDSLIRRRTDDLRELYRLLTWLAMARLTAASVVVLMEPLEGASREDQSYLRRLLREASLVHRHIFVAARHQATAVSLGAQKMPALLATAQ